MQNVTDRTSNPFGMAPDCEQPVFGYGDANADFHLIGDHPGVHGGVETGVPFTDAAAGDRLRAALSDAGVLDDPADVRPTLDNWFFSYLLCCLPAREEPTVEEYAEYEPFFDAELRAIAAHVLLPVGERAIDHVLRTYSAIDPSTIDPESAHAEEHHGSGFLIVPIADPGDWTAAQHEAIVDRLRALSERDYRQTTDLGRFLATDDPYLVR